MDRQSKVHSFISPSNPFDKLKMSRKSRNIFITMSNSNLFEVEDVWPQGNHSDSSINSKVCFSSGLLI